MVTAKPAKKHQPRCGKSQLRPVCWAILLTVTWLLASAVAALMLSQLAAVPNTTVATMPRNGTCTPSITFRATSKSHSASSEPCFQCKNELLNDIAAKTIKEPLLEKLHKKYSDTGKTRYRRDINKVERTPVKIMQSSWQEESTAYQAKHGLVTAILEAYNNHHNLILRPDDVWQAILTQFSFYVNSNAEKLRSKFVAFDGQQTLVVSMKNDDFGEAANRMVDEQIMTHIRDRSVADWILPNFTTTTPNDRVAASVSIMATLQTYFKYVCQMLCGIPNVTLEGTVNDWQLLRTKIDRLLSYDLEESSNLMTEWHKMLAPVLDQLVESARGRADLDFWDHVALHVGGGSGPSYVSGWVTVFACFEQDGTWQGDGRMEPGDLFHLREKLRPGPWPKIETESLPIGTVSVPVLFDDNGIQYDTTMIAGHLAYELQTSVTGMDGPKDSVRPRIDWSISYNGTANPYSTHYQQGEILVNHRKPVSSTATSSALKTMDA